jgi:tyrosyl-tRNA synthetase
VRLRRTSPSSGAGVNDKTLSDEKQLLGLADINEQGVIKLSAGRKRHALIRPV